MSTGRVRVTHGLAPHVRLAAQDEALRGHVGLASQDVHLRRHEDVGALGGYRGERVPNRDECGGGRRAMKTTAGDVPARDRVRRQMRIRHGAVAEPQLTS